MSIRLLAWAIMALGSSSALAHTGAGEVSGFTSGLAHPFLGLYHILAMTAVGMWAGLLGGRAVLGLPRAFLGALLAGVSLALAGIAVPAVEIGIAASVLVLGLAIALRVRTSAVLAGIACAAFGLAHGHAHGVEIGEGSNAGSFVAGFVVATALLHGGGLALAGSITSKRLALNRLIGGGMAVIGAVLLVV